MLFILFQLGSDRYALPAREVVEVLPLVSVKVLPGAPAGGAGLMNYRGAPVPVIDLTTLAFGRPAACRVSTRLLIVRYPHPRGGERLLGIVAERATETITKDPSEFQPTGVATHITRYLGPVAHDPRGLIQRVDVHALLADELRTALFPDHANNAVSSPVDAYREEKHLLRTSS